MYGEKAFNLIKELSRNEDVLTPYNIELVNAVFAEIQELHEQNKEDGAAIVNESGTATNTNALYPTLRIGSSALKRNVRCLLAYHYNRLNTLKKMRWEFGSVLPPDIKANLSADEIAWFSKYSEMLGTYMRHPASGGLNLYANLRPPKSLYIEVRCLVDYGKFELSDGTVLLLKKDSRHYLPRSECEEMITQGVFQHII